MNENLKDELGNVNPICAEEMAQMLVEQHGLAEFVRNWNNGDSGTSLISNLDNLKEALDIAFCGSETPINVYAPPFEADFEYRRSIEHWVDCILLPVIDASFEAALQKLLNRWVRETLRSEELRQKAPAPFLSEADWLRWLVQSQFHKRLTRPFEAAGIVSQLEKPPQLILCSPDGGPLFPKAAEEAVAAYALLNNVDLALKHGWLAKPTLH